MTKTLRPPIFADERRLLIRVHLRKSAALIFLCMCIAATYADVKAQAERHSYKIDLKIDFDNLTYTGTERVRWINRGEKPASVIYFHLYQNLRTGDQSFTPTATADSDEPRIDIVEVRSGVDEGLLFSSVDDQGTTLRIN